MHDTRPPLCNKIPHTLLASALLLALLPQLGCLEGNREPAGLRAARDSGGARIIFDLDERPFPEVPFPNDVATINDPTSPTGLRLNISTEAPTEQEQRVRRALNRQTGFGVFSPITVRFDAPLDLHEIIDRHHEPTPDFSDDAVYLVNVDRESPGFGELVMLDMGRGNFPLTLSEPNRYFENDPRVRGTNLIYETVEEVDLNENGILDPIEDTDDDGVWDKPNVLDEGSDPYAFGQLLEFYERETNTLVMRPVVPLRPGTTYAMVLTSALRGADLLPIDSPFAYINHTRQTAELEPLRTILPRRFPERFDQTLDQVRFAWSFTTRTPTRELEVIREGLYGSGPLSTLAEEFPADFMMIHDAKGGKEGENPLIFRVDQVLNLVAPLVAEVAGQAGGDAIVQTFESVDYVVSGTFRSPHFLVDQDGLADPLPTPDEIEEGDHFAIDRLNMANEDDYFDIDPDTGEATYTEDEVTFICVVPKETKAQKAPFPTIIYSHAIGSTRLEGMVFAGAMSKFGMATCAIDAIGHGIAIPPDLSGLLESISNRVGLKNLGAIAEHSRASDMNDDGVVDPGGDYFTTDLLHSRDMIRQTTVDQLQLIRILRTFDGTKRFPAKLDETQPYIKARRDIIASGFDADGDGTSEIAGDFNGDGVVDLGGDAPMVAWGTSLGGIQTMVLSGIEPSIKATVSNAGGGGLLDIAARTSISNARVGALLRTVGPLVTGRPKAGTDGATTEIAWILPDVTRDARHVFAEVEGLEDGDVIVLRNLEREVSEFVSDEDLYARVRVRDGRFRVSVATDGLSALERRALQNIPGGIRVREEVLGCVEASECGEMSCPGRSYCDEENTCQPIAECVQSADTAEAFSDPNHEAYAIRNPTDYGDPLEVEIYSDEGVLKHTISTFEKNVVHDNLLYPAGAPLAALADGWGIDRQTPRMRRFLGIGAMILEPADPAVWAMHYQRDPLTYEYEREGNRTGKTNALIVGTLGDQTVPINTGITLARAVGALDYIDEDSRYGMTPNQYLVQRHAYEGIHWLDRYPAYPNSLFDPDDLDRGTFRSKRGDNLPSPESDAPLRAQRVLPDGGIQALRFPYLDERGAHTFNAPNPDLPFDIHTFMLNQTGWYLAHGGRAMTDDICLEADVMMSTCSFFDQENFTPEFE